MTESELIRLLTNAMEEAAEEEPDLGLSDVARMPLVEILAAHAVGVSELEGIDPDPEEFTLAQLNDCIERLQRAGRAIEDADPSQNIVQFLDPVAEIQTQSGRLISILADLGARKALEYLRAPREERLH